MEENGGPNFDHEWGTLVVEEFDSKPLLEAHHELMINNDAILVVNGSMEKGSDEFKEFANNSSPEETEFRGSIAERRAAKLGFNAASMMNVAQFKISSPPSSSSSPPLASHCSPYLTIPPGISPAALLDSPVMLPNSLVQPSPTTGSFSFPPCNYESLTLNPVSPTANRGKDDCAADSFLEFKPPPPPPGDTQMLCASNIDNQPPTTSKSPTESTKAASMQSCDMDISTETKFPENLSQNAIKTDFQRCHTGISDNQMPRLKESIKEEIGAYSLTEVDTRGIYPSAAAGMTRNAEDGYCWRKYGQKHVKGSEYPRSYYKCNNSNCLVKKKVERSHDGEITEIIYKGAHNHPKPHPRLSLGTQASSSEFMEMETSEDCGSFPKIEGGTGSKYNQLRTKDSRAGSDWRADGFERTSSSSVLNEISNSLASGQGKSVNPFGSVETSELATIVAGQDCDNEDGGTQGSTSQGDDADGDESEPKRRKKETFSAEAYLPSRSTREPRIILQIESEIDVLDDGYRWRKYGQKVVKGNPNPRSYYKCTTAGCPVRKHVERASEDIKSVITTYEGKHNHEVPTTKTSAGTASVGSSPPNVSDSNPILTLPRNSHVPNPEMQVHDLPLHYQMKSALGNEFARIGMLGDLVSDLKIGASSIYQMKFPPLQSPMPYSPFLMNSRGSDQSQTSCIGAPFVPEFPLSIPTISVPRSTNMAVNSFFSNNHARTSGALVQSSLGNQQIKESDLRLFKPKEEQKDDHLYDSCLATPDNGSAASSTVFCRAIGNFPS